MSRTEIVIGILFFGLAAMSWLAMYIHTGCTSTGNWIESGTRGIQL